MNEANYEQALSKIPSTPQEHVIRDIERKNISLGTLFLYETSYLGVNGQTAFGDIPNMHYLPTGLIS